MPVLTGTDNQNTINGSTANDTISGLGGDDTLTGGNGIDRIYGGDGSDKINGGFDSDYLYGQNGDDWLTPYLPSSLSPTDVWTGSYDFVDGGAGFDVVDFSTLALNIPPSNYPGTFLIVDLAAQAASKPTSPIIVNLVPAETTKIADLVGVEAVQGTQFNDIVLGDAHNNTFFHGNFSLSGAERPGGVVDTYDGREGIDTYVAGRAANTRAAPNGSHTAGIFVSFEIGYGSIATDLVNAFGNPGAVPLAAGDGVAYYEIWKDQNSNGIVDDGELSKEIDILRNVENYVGTDLDDVIWGDAKDEVIAGGLGSNFIFGGGGFDFASYEGIVLPTGYTLSIQFDPQGGVDGRAQVLDSNGVAVSAGPSYLQDTLNGIKGVVGSAGSDDITVTTLGAVGAKIFAGDGGDSITGGVGDDLIDGGAGDDVLIGDFGNAPPGFAPFPPSNDVLTGGKGADVIDGGAGFDYASYRDSAGGVAVDLLRGEGLDVRAVTGRSDARVGAPDGESIGDRLLNVEAVVGSRYDDVLRGDGGANILEGRDGADLLFGCDGADRIYGESDAASPVAQGTGDLRPWTEKNAEICGPACDPSLPLGVIYDPSFDDVAYGGCGDDVIYGQAGSDSLFGEEDADQLEGGDGNDYLSGGLANDSLRGGKGTDILEGGDGDDLLDGGAGFDVMIGGAGVDTVDYGASPSAVTIFMGRSWLNTGGDASADYVQSVLDFLITGGDPLTIAANASFIALLGVLGANNGTTSDYTFQLSDVLLDVEAVKGSAFDDQITGDALDNRLFGGLGADTLDGGEGVDTVDYSDKTSPVVVTLNGSTNTSVTVGGVAEDTIRNFESVTGGAGADTLTGDGLANALAGGGGNDFLKGGAAADTLDGGAGVDFADYRDKTTSVAVTLNGVANTTVTVGGVAEDTIRNIENVLGGSGADTLAGDSLANALAGGAGDDLLRGGLGKDVLDGGAGSDVAIYSEKTASVVVTLNGAANATVTVGGVAEDTIRNIERVLGGSGADTLTGDDLANGLAGLGGDDSLRGGLGKDVLDGGAGVDLAIYSEKTFSVVVTLNGSTNATVTVGGLAEDAIRNVEKVLGGSGADTLTGDGLANGLAGGSGNDILKGGLGNDALDGGAGVDIADYRDKTTSVTVTLNGAANAAVTVGGVAEDTIRNIEIVLGGSGADTLGGDSLANAFAGGGGVDRFVFKPAFGKDTVVDFSASDKLVIDNAIFADFASVLGAAQQVGSDTVVTASATDTITLKNFAVANLVQSQVEFI